MSIKKWHLFATFCFYALTIPIDVVEMIQGTSTGRADRPVDDFEILLNPREKLWLIPHFFVYLHSLLTIAYGEFQR